MELCICSVPNRELQVIGQHHRCSVGSSVFYVERKHLCKNISCNVKSAQPCQAGTGLAMSWLWKSGRSSRICSNNLLLCAGFVLRSFVYFSPKLISEVSFVANES